MKLLGYDVRAKESRHNLQWLPRRQLLVQLQDLQFARNVQPITALRFHGGSPVRRELFQCGMRSFLQLVRRGPAELLHRIEDPAAFARNLFVTRALNSQFIFFRAARRMHQMRVRIHKSGQRHAPAQIEFFRRARLRPRFDLCTRPHGCNHALPHQ